LWSSATAITVPDRNDRYPEAPGATQNDRRGPRRLGAARAARRNLVRIGGLSNRPRDSHYDPVTRLLLVGTRNQYGHTGGALAVVDLESGRIERYDHLVPDQQSAR
jgi:hypothetical protein